MPSNRSTPEGRSVRLLARPLGGLLQGCSTVYLGARRLKSSAKHRYQARTAPTAAGIATVVSSLSKVPQHLSAIIDAEPSADGPNVDKLIQEAAEFAAWSVAAGIPTISIYDGRGKFVASRHCDKFIFLNSYYRNFEAPCEITAHLCQPPNSAVRSGSAA